MLCPIESFLLLVARTIFSSALSVFFRRKAVDFSEFLVEPGFVAKATIIHYLLHGTLRSVQKHSGAMKLDNTQEVTGGAPTYFLETTI